MWENTKLKQYQIDGFWRSDASAFFASPSSDPFFFLSLSRPRCFLTLAIDLSYSSLDWDLCCPITTDQNHHHHLLWYKWQHPSLSPHPSKHRGQWAGMTHVFIFFNFSKKASVDFKNYFIKKLCCIYFSGILSCVRILFSSCCLVRLFRIVCLLPSPSSKTDEPIWPPNGNHPFPATSISQKQETNSQSILYHRASSSVEVCPFVAVAFPSSFSHLCDANIISKLFVCVNRARQNIKSLLNCLNKNGSIAYAFIPSQHFSEYLNTFKSELFNVCTVSTYVYSKQ